MIQVPPDDITNLLNITDYDVYLYKSNRRDGTGEIAKKHLQHSEAVNGFLSYNFKFNPSDYISSELYYFKVTPYNKHDYEIDFNSSFTPFIKPSKSHCLQYFNYLMWSSHN